MGHLLLNLEYFKAEGRALRIMDLDQYLEKMNTNTAFI